LSRLAPLAAGVMVGLAVGVTLLVADVSLPGAGVGWRPADRCGARCAGREARYGTASPAPGWS
jgi:hypothetical protein